MRLLMKHFITVIVFLFVFKLAIQAQGHSNENELPRTVKLAKMSVGEPIPAKDYGHKVSDTFAAE